MQSLIERLLSSAEPSIRWKVRSLVFEESGPAIESLRNEIKASTRVKALLANRDTSGRIKNRKNPYDKWQGSHWILASLADLGYPSGDKDLLKTKDEILDFWLSKEFFIEFEAAKKSDAYKKLGVPCMKGRYRRCASQQGYALWYLQKLGLSDSRLSNLVERLLYWQWPDGGWNCDKTPGPTFLLSFTQQSLYGV